MTRVYNNPVLVIEDSDEDFLMIKRGFEMSGVKAEIIRLQNMMQAREWLKSEESQASLIMLDLNLPDSSGHDIITAVKKHHRFKKIPIIVLSTSCNPADIGKCYDLGANSFHAKPIETPVFHTVVQELADYWFGKALLVDYIR